MSPNIVLENTHNCIVEIPIPNPYKNSKKISKNDCITLWQSWSYCSSIFTFTVINTHIYIIIFWMYSIVKIIVMFLII